jgi:NTP pyrophosphatase (non-canonical NTP hydrolase)
MPLIHKGLVKLLEEAGELQQIVAKKISYMDTDIHPDGKGSLKERMEDEIADLLAATEYVTHQFNLDQFRIESRKRDKLRVFKIYAGEP